ncbi:MAG TPA: UDP-N-acetylmuramoyl-L-alanine--D-glutamate ligase [Actinomycetota bacterium]|nr:UDP-N-acetylmuramoyl-L-alanine--D-glutamate ligase [Actinomycetota bacterium]
MTGRFAGERVVVVGAGVAGASAARVLASEGASVLVTEARPAADVPAVAELEARGVEVRAGGHDPHHLDDATLLLVGPGVPPDAPVVRWARDRGLPVWGEMELGARLAHRPYLAVTGTNGKTTVTSMIESCLRAGGLDALACGNIGLPFPEAALQDRDVLVVEVSSFQLALHDSFHPSISVLVNLAPDHLDWHGSLEAYVEAKRRVYARQSGADVHIGNRDDPVSAPISAAAPCEIRWFRSGPPSDGEVGFEGDELIARLGGIHRLGRIDAEGAGAREDAAAAAAVALAYGVEPTVVAAALASFRRAPHRGEVVASVDGVRFIDNSKATNVHAAAAAIDAAGSVVLIAGGRAKGADLSPLREHASGVRAVVAIGEAAADVVEVFDGIAPTSTADSIEDAVRDAFAAARPGEAVLLAPACASWDQFRSYAERGDRFAAAARSLHAEAGARG